ncbi:amidase protein [Salinisphaera shabanensis E1L3A]|jgi:Asp-tRNA(Asn)/Glu-tRNA(Gln) amidotransferase A subunit family amidase|uniref:Amidase protein n=1 Tax=Salinisphaera shabanensis E1L3A TaxID=1033802 RepID=U2FVN9_9GAMM|nr:amidase family protein [Salinisphaera shabanensis]ERJ19969.1 amidase protein [Salinisphaera shabanensis E1L3A]
MKSRLFFLLSLLAALLAGCGSDSGNSVASGSGSPSTPTEPATFNFVEGTIAQAQAAMRDGTLTCEALVQGYIDRIRAYDDAGPELRSVVRVNPLALDRARMLDASYASDGPSGPLHCVPVLLKDNFDTVDVTTTAGGMALQYNQTPDDAFSVAGIIDAGGLILGKANLDEFAFGFRGSSSVRGQVKNAYDPTKGPGGSSSGTGAAIAASFAMTGTGSDTGGSIRVPSSLEGLVGIRPSLRLVSQDGILPLAASQDTGGPMCRTVEDCALMLDAMVGFDDSPAANQRQAFAYDSAAIENAHEYASITNVPTTYTDFLDAEGLDGARIAAILPLFGNGDDENAQVQSALMAAIEQMRSAGATVDILTEADLAERNVSTDQLTDFPSNSRFEFRRDLTGYLMSWSSDLDGHVRSFDAVAASGGYEERNASTFAFYGMIGMALENTDDMSEEAVDYRDQYQRNIEERPTIVRNGLMRILENRDGDDMSANALGAPYDTLLYPSVQSLAPDLGRSPSAGSNNRLSPFSGFPALSMPAGMVVPAGNDDMADPEPALPVGMELLAREFDEPTLIRLAYSYQETFQPRAAPTFTPELAANDD